MLQQLIAGPQTGSPGSSVNAGGTTDGAARVADAHGRYAAAVAGGNVYIGSNLGGTPVTTQAGLSVTTPALTLYNPAGGTKILSLLGIGIGINAAPAAAAQLWLCYSTNVVAGVTTAPVTNTLANVTNALVGATNSPVGQCYRITTLGVAPLLLIPLGGTTGAAAIGGVTLYFDIAGAVAVAPGSLLTIQTSSAAAITACFIWEELSGSFQ